jgi:putative N-acetylmannosamine-6-phosphate epimerase
MTASTIELLRGGLIVSTQADPVSPLANPVVIAAMAQAAEAFAAGAHAVVVGTGITATGWLVSRFLEGTPRGHGQ